MQSVKVAKCCFCGTRAALVLRSAGRQELCCQSCGAPLHNLKRLKVDEGSSAPARAVPVPGASSHARAMSRRDSGPKSVPRRYPEYDSRSDDRSDHGRKASRSRPKKSMSRKIFGAIWDVVEDIID